jgi:hypothetical protein
MTASRSSVKALRRRAWLDTSGLPEYRTDQHKPLVDRWMETVGKLPD